MPYCAEPRKVKCHQGRGPRIVDPCPLPPVPLRAGNKKRGSRFLTAMLQTCDTARRACVDNLQDTIGAWLRDMPWLVDRSLLDWRRWGVSQSDQPNTKGSITTRLFLEVDPSLTHGKIIEYLCTCLRGRICKTRDVGPYIALELLHVTYIFQSVSQDVRSSGRPRRCCRAASTPCSLD